jgi:hypothetical protein
MAEASKESAEIMAALGREQLDFAKLQYADAAPFLKQISDAQVATQNETTQQARDAYAYQKGTFRPAEERLVADAEKFSSDAYREQQATQAAADAGDAFSTTQGMNSRALTAMGVNPNSGRFTGASRTASLGLAAARTGATNATRREADNVGYARRLDAVGLGRNLTGASQGAYGLAINAGNSAGANSMAAGNQYMAGMGQGASTIASGRNMLQSGLGDILDSQTGLANGAQAAGASGTGAAIGAVGGIAVAMI